MIFHIPVDSYCGNPVDAEHCPVANAIRPFLAKDVDVTVTHKHCTLYKKGSALSHRIKFDDAIPGYIAEIDRGNRNLHFSIRLDIPLGFHKDV